MTLPDERIKLPLKLQIYYTHITGVVDHCGETDMHPKDWVFDSNADRWCQVACGDPESEWHENRECSCIEDIDDFEFKWENKNVEET